MRRRWRRRRPRGTRRRARGGGVPARAARVPGGAAGRATPVTRAGPGSRSPTGSSVSRQAVHKKYRRHVDLEEADDVRTVHRAGAPGGGAGPGGRARARRPDIGSEHLLLGLCRARRQPRGGAARRPRGDPRGGRGGPAPARGPPGLPDREALASVGHRPRRGPRPHRGRLRPGRAREHPGRRRAATPARGVTSPSSRGAKKALELSLREAVRRGDRALGSEHMVLGLLHGETGRAAAVLHARGSPCTGCARRSTTSATPGCRSGM